MAESTDTHRLTSLELTGIDGVAEPAVPQSEFAKMSTVKAADAGELLGLVEQLAAETRAKDESDAADALDDIASDLQGVLTDMGESPDDDDTVGDLDDDDAGDATDDMVDEGEADEVDEDIASLLGVDVISEEMCPSCGCVLDPEKAKVKETEVLSCPMCGVEIKDTTTRTVEARTVEDLAAWVRGVGPIAAANSLDAHPATDLLSARATAERLWEIAEEQELRRHTETYKMVLENGLSGLREIESRGATKLLGKAIDALSSAIGMLSRKRPRKKKSLGSQLKAQLKGMAEVKGRGKNFTIKAASPEHVESIEKALELLGGKVSVAKDGTWRVREALYTQGEHLMSDERAGTLAEWMETYPDAIVQDYGKSGAKMVFTDGLTSDAKWNLSHLVDWVVSAHVSGPALVIVPMEGEKREKSTGSTFRGVRLPASKSVRKSEPYEKLMGYIDDLQHEAEIVLQDPDMRGVKGAYKRAEQLKELLGDTMQEFLLTDRKPNHTTVARNGVKIADTIDMLVEELTKDPGESYVSGGDRIGRGGKLKFGNEIADRLVAEKDEWLRAVNEAVEGQKLSLKSVRNGVQKDDLGYTDNGDIDILIRDIQDAGERLSGYEGFDVELKSMEARLEAIKRKRSQKIAADLLERERVTLADMVESLKTRYGQNNKVDAAAHLLEFGVLRAVKAIVADWRGVEKSGRNWFHGSLRNYPGEVEVFSADSMPRDPKYSDVKGPFGSSDQAERSADRMKPRKVRTLKTIRKGDDASDLRAMLERVKLIGGSGSVDDGDELVCVITYDSESGPQEAFIYVGDDEDHGVEQNESDISEHLMQNEDWDRVRREFLEDEGREAEDDDLMAYLEDAQAAWLIATYRLSPEDMRNALSGTEAEEYVSGLDVDDEEDTEKNVTLTPVSRSPVKRTKSITRKAEPSDEEAIGAKLYARGYRYRLTPDDGSIEPLYTKTMGEASALMREDYADKRFLVEAIGEDGSPVKRTKSLTTTSKAHDKRNPGARYRVAVLQHVGEEKPGYYVVDMDAASSNDYVDTFPTKYEAQSLADSLNAGHDEGEAREFVAGPRMKESFLHKSLTTTSVPSITGDRRNKRGMRKWQYKAPELLAVMDGLEDMTDEQLEELSGAFPDVVAWHTKGQPMRWGGGSREPGPDIDIGDAVWLDVAEAISEILGRNIFEDQEGRNKYEKSARMRKADAVEMDDAAYREAADKLIAEYAPRIQKALEQLAGEVKSLGYVVEGPFQHGEGDAEQAISVRLPGSADADDEDEDASIDISFSLAESKEYDGSNEGVNFKSDAVTYGGRILGGITPYNYSNNVWVPFDDEAEIEERFNMVAGALDDIGNNLSEWLGDPQEPEEEEEEKSVGKSRLHKSTAYAVYKDNGIGKPKQEVFVDRAKAIAFAKREDADGINVVEMDDKTGKVKRTMGDLSGWEESEVQAAKPRSSLVALSARKAQKPDPRYAYEPVTDAERGKKPNPNRPAPRKPFAGIPVTPRPVTDDAAEGRKYTPKPGPKKPLFEGMPVPPKKSKSALRKDIAPQERLRGLFELVKEFSAMLPPRSLASYTKASLLANALETAEPARIQSALGGFQSTVASVPMTPAMKLAYDKIIGGTNDYLAKHGQQRQTAAKVIELAHDRRTANLSPGPHRALGDLIQYANAAAIGDRKGKARVTAATQYLKSLGLPFRQIVRFSESLVRKGLNETYEQDDASLASSLSAAVKGNLKGQLKAMLDKDGVEEGWIGEGMKLAGRAEDIAAKVQAKTPPESAQITSLAADIRKAGEKMGVDFEPTAKALEALARDEVKKSSDEARQSLLSTIQSLKTAATGDAKALLDRFEGSLKSLKHSDAASTLTKLTALPGPYGELREGFAGVLGEATQPAKTQESRSVAQTLRARHRQIESAALRIEIEMARTEIRKSKLSGPMSALKTALEDLENGTEGAAQTDAKALKETVESAAGQDYEPTGIRDAGKVWLGKLNSIRASSEFKAKDKADKVEAAIGRVMDAASQAETLTKSATDRHGTTLQDAITLAKAYVLDHGGKVEKSAGVLKDGVWSMTLSGDGKTWALKSGEMLVADDGVSQSFPFVSLEKAVSTMKSIRKANYNYGRDEQYDRDKEDEILYDASVDLGIEQERLSVDFEHGQYFVTDMKTGAQWSVAESEMGFDYEEITPGFDEEDHEQESRVRKVAKKLTEYEKDDIRAALRSVKNGIEQLRKIGTTAEFGMDLVDDKFGVDEASVFREMLDLLDRAHETGLRFSGKSDTRKSTRKSLSPLLKAERMAGVVGKSAGIRKGPVPGMAVGGPRQLTSTLEDMYGHVFSGKGLESPMDFEGAEGTWESAEQFIKEYEEDAETELSADVKDEIRMAIEQGAQDSYYRSFGEALASAIESLAEEWKETRSITASYDNGEIVINAPDDAILWAWRQQTEGIGLAAWGGDEDASDIKSAKQLAGILDGLAEVYGVSDIESRVESNMDRWEPSGPRYQDLVKIIEASGAPTEEPEDE